MHTKKARKTLTKFFKICTFVLIPIVLISCKGPDGKFKLPGGDARKTPADPAKRVEQNLKEGRGFRLSGEGGFFSNRGGGVYEFATSNELWRASLDTIDFMPLASVNYSGGLIVTDWYNNNQIADESIKISIRFLTNEIRSDALDIKVFTKKCLNGSSCQIFETSGALVPELTRQILKTATLYEKEKKDKTKEKNKDYKVNYPDMN
tara:strand:- start:484 stop:1101 length:618 start_codon:yes stop_codon:yes gene_type:complete